MITFSRHYFLQELRAFLEIIGTRSFWNGDKPRQALKGLLYVYANTDGLTEQDKNLLYSIKQEYDMRLCLVLDNNLYTETSISSLPSQI